METDLGWWTLVWVSNGNYPSATFLDGETGSAPKNLRPWYEYSIDASDIFFEEVAMWLDGDTQKYFGFFAPEGFDNSRAFEALPWSPQTCIESNAYYTFDGWGRKYWQRYFTYEESLITNRRDNTAWWIDLGDTWCSSSGNSLAVYRVNTWHGVAAWNWPSAGTDWTKAISNELSPLITEVADSDFPERWIDRDVWIMVR